MVRILCIVDSMDTGGAETFLMKIYREIAKKNYQMDFIVTTNHKGIHEDEINILGGHLYKIPPKTQNPFKSFISINRIVKNNQYKHVLRISRNTLSSLDLFSAKLGGAKYLALRSNNTVNDGGVFTRLLHKLFMPLSNLICNIKIAPSKNSGIYMFGIRQMKKVKILNNGIDFDLYQFNKKTRTEIRTSLNLNDDFLIGHIGRFEEQKNHKFLLELFKIYQKNEKNAKLLLIGKGNLENSILNYATKIGVRNRLIHIRETTEINKYLMAMDLYLFPSFYEGLPNTVIEAQAAGLYCLVSDTITKEVQISNNIRFINIKNYDSWINAIKLVKLTNHCSENHKSDLDSSYSIKKVAEDFINIFSL